MKKRTRMESITEGIKRSSTRQEGLELQEMWNIFEEWREKTLTIMQDARQAQKILATGILRTLDKKQVKDMNRIKGSRKEFHSFQAFSKQKEKKINECSYFSGQSQKSKQQRRHKMKERLRGNRGKVKKRQVEGRRK